MWRSRDTNPALFASTLDKGKYSASRSGRLTLRKESSKTGKRRRISALLGIERKNKGGIKIRNKRENKDKHKATRMKYTSFTYGALHNRFINQLPKHVRSEVGGGGGMGKG